MKLVGIISTAVLSLALGAAAPAYAQQDDHAQQDEKKMQQDKPAQQEEKHAQQQDEKKMQQDKPAQQEEKHAQQQDEKKMQQDKPVQQEDKHAQQQDEKKMQQDKPVPQEDKHAQQQRGNEPQRTEEQVRVQQTAWKEHSSQHWDSDHRTWQQRGGYRGYRIPDEQFRGYFGREHEFRIYGLPFLVVGGYPRFQYSGYWFSPVDPWPGYWAANWYDTDDVYVVYVDNGYYLYNRRYPNVGIAINISL